MFEWWVDLVSWVNHTYKVNPYAFIFFYVVSIPIYWWGLFDIAAGSPLNPKDKVFNWKRIVRGFLINRFAWAMPYLYVMIFAKELPLWLWAFLILMIILSTSYFITQVIRGKVRQKLPTFLRRKL